MFKSNSNYLKLSNSVSILGIFGILGFSLSGPNSMAMQRNAQNGSDLAGRSIPVDANRTLTLNDLRNAYRACSSDVLNEIVAQEAVSEVQLPYYLKKVTKQIPLTKVFDEKKSFWWELHPTKIEPSFNSDLLTYGFVREFTKFFAVASVQLSSTAVFLDSIIIDRTGAHEYERRATLPHFQVRFDGMTWETSYAHGVYEGIDFGTGKVRARDADTYSLINTTTLNPLPYLNYTLSKGDSSYDAAGNLIPGGEILQNLELVYPIDYGKAVLLINEDTRQVTKLTLNEEKLASCFLSHLQGR